MFWRIRFDELCFMAAAIAEFRSLSMDEAAIESDWLESNVCPRLK